MTYDFMEDDLLALRLRYARLVRYATDYLVRSGWEPLNEQEAQDFLDSANRLRKELGR